MDDWPDRICYTDPMSKRKRTRVHRISLKEQIRLKPGMFILYLLIRLSVVLVLVAQAFNHDWVNVGYCILTLFLLTIPSFIENNWHIDIPDTLEVIVILFIYAAEILGEIRSYYIHVPAWDTALHTITGFLAAAVGFSLVDIVNRNENTKLFLSPLYVAIAAFAFSMTVGVLWEFFEFSCDCFLGMDTQKDAVIHTINSVYLDPTMSNRPVSIRDISSTAVNGIDLGIDGYLDIGLYDTMKDLFVNFIGALVFSIIGFFYLKNSSHGRFAKRFIPTLMAEKQKEAEKQG